MPFSRDSQDNFKAYTIISYFQNLQYTCWSFSWFCYLVFIFLIRVYQYFYHITYFDSIQILSVAPIWNQHRLAIMQIENNPFMLDCLLCSCNKRLFHIWYFCIIMKDVYVLYARLSWWWRITRKEPFRNVCRR